MSKATLKKELDKLEKIVLELPCMQTKQVELPPQPDGRPYHPAFWGKHFECPHCEALKTIARIRLEIGSK